MKKRLPATKAQNPILFRYLSSNGYHQYAKGTAIAVIAE